MLRKIFTALILLPLAIIVVSLAVANRENVTLSFDPFDPGHPALTRALPLYLLMLMLLIGGVFVGGIAAWLTQGKWRRAARLADAHDFAVSKQYEPIGLDDLLGLVVDHHHGNVVSFAQAL